MIHILLTPSDATRRDFNLGVTRTGTVLYFGHLNLTLVEESRIHGQHDQRNHKHSECTNQYVTF